MFEFEVSDHAAREAFFATNPSLRVERGPINFSSADRIAPLAWSEHCVECAIPHCYSTCDLYSRRPDGKCRRFTFGIFPNPAVRTWLPYGVEVDFRLISHLWTKGNVNTMPARAYRAFDSAHRAAGQLVRGLSQLLTAPSPNRKLVRGFYHFRKRLVERLRAKRGRRAEGFLLQVINPHAETLRLRLEVVPEPRGPEQMIFQHGFELPPGFSEHWIPVESIQSQVDLGADFGVSLLLGNTDPRLLYLLCAEFVSGLRGPLAVARPAVTAQSGPTQQKAKAVIWDLDNTLWQGVLVETENEAPALRPGIVEIVRELDQRGILQSVASKNNHDEAWPILEAAGLAEYFLHPRINWEPKGGNVREIIRRLNIGVDTVAFIDDQPFERGEVSASIPGIMVLPETAISDLLQDPRFQGSTSEEARNRRQLYLLEAKRQEDFTQHGGEYTDFLRACGMVVRVFPPQHDNLDRVQELIQRTNQMNFSGNRYSREELALRIASPAVECYVLQCRDRYGDYGIVGFCMVERGPSAARMVDLAMSCRVQSKHVEHAFLLALCERYRTLGLARFVAEFRRTPRNAPVGRVFEDLSFTREADAGGREVYSRDLTAPMRVIDYVEVRMEADRIGAGA